MSDKTLDKILYCPTYPIEWVDTEKQELEFALKERLKEITCLNSIRRGMDLELELDEICQHISKHLIVAMQFPDITVVAIEIDGKQFNSEKCSKPFTSGLHAHIIIDGAIFGKIQVSYLENRSFLLPEEQNLINSIAVDLTWWLERKRTTEALRAALFQTKQVEFALDQHAIVATTDPRGIIKYVNQKFCEISEYSLKEIFDRPCFLIDLVNSGHHPKTFYRRMWSTVSSGRVWNGEIKSRAKDGAFFWTDTTIVPFTDEHNKITQYIAICNDISKRKQAECELTNAKDMAENASRAKDSFLATMSHEIRTPLGGVLSMLELLGYTPLNNDQRETLLAAHTSAESLLRILNDILDWSKIEARKLELAPRPTSITQLIHAVVNTYARIASAKNLILAPNIDARLSSAHVVDPLRLSQILNNFVSNALKFTDIGQVVVRAELLDRHENCEVVCFSVTDTGIGISEDLQSSMFQDYNQLSADTARLYGGTGLGMAICRRLVELLGGQIALKSVPKEGSTFSITLKLPISEIDLEKTALEQNDIKKLNDIKLSIPFLTQGVQPMILVVDDHPINRKLMENQIKLLGLPSIIAANGEAALALWRNGGFNLIITDCHMPIMDGYALTQTIRKIEINESLPHIPIIGWTANALPEEVEHTRMIGMDALMTKPASLLQLKEMLEIWLPSDSMIVDNALSEDKDKTNIEIPIDSVVLAKIANNPIDVLGILKDFIEQTQSDFAELMVAMKRQDFSACARIAHRIKGASRMVGAHRLAAACETTEKALHECAIEALEVAKAMLDRELDNIEGYFVKTKAAQADHG